MRTRTKVILSAVGGILLLGIIEAPAAGAPQTAVPTPTPTVTQTITPEPSQAPSEDATPEPSTGHHRHVHTGVSVGGRHHRIHLGL